GEPEPTSAMLPVTPHPAIAGSDDDRRQNQTSGESPTQCASRLNFKTSLPKISRHGGIVRSTTDLPFPCGQRTKLMTPVILVKRGTDPSAARGGGKAAY